MSQVNTFVGAAKRLEDLDIPRIGSRIGVGEDEIHAFMEVEASGSGFDSKGRPKMLFEPHVFYRNLSGAARDQAVAEGLAYKSWLPGKYPADSYPRLKAAMRINGNAALMSASWGLGQILGENYRAAGYNSPQAMVTSFMADEENHLNAMVSFIIAAGIDDDLRAHRWDIVARVYNGPSYAKHGYHTRLAAAYKKWAKIKDTPWDGNLAGMEAPVSPVATEQTYPTARIGSKGWVVEHLQKELLALGYGTGAVDGKFGEATRAAVLAFQADHGLKTDGVAGPNTWDVMENSARPKPLGGTRVGATVDDLSDKGSKTIKNADLGEVSAGVVAATGGLAGLDSLVGNAELAGGLLGRAQSVLGQVTAELNDTWPILVMLGGGAVIWYFQKVKKARVQDHRSGANMSR